MAFLCNVHVFMPFRNQRNKLASTRSSHPALLGCHVMRNAATRSPIAVKLSWSIVTVGGFLPSRSALHMSWPKLMSIQNCVLLPQDLGSTDWPNGPDATALDKGQFQGRAKPHGRAQSQGVQSASWCANCAIYQCTPIFAATQNPITIGMSEARQNFAGMSLMSVNFPSLAFREPPHLDVMIIKGQNQE